jgi:hypothetical protein
MGIMITAATIMGNLNGSMSNKNTSIHTDITPTAILPVKFEAGTSFNFLIKTMLAIRIIKSLNIRARRSKGGNPLKSTTATPTAEMQILSATGSSTRPVIEVARHLRAKKPSR